MAVQPTRRLFTIDDYYRMGAAGILGEDDRVELIEGEIIQMPPIGDPHALCVRRTNNRVGRTVGDAAILDVQNPLRLSDRSEPMPDVMLLRPRADFYATGKPTAADVLLLIEVSDTTLRYDRQVKVPLYAREGVPEVWIADLRRALILAYRDPTPTGYRVTETYRRGDRITLSQLPGVSIAVEDILG
jgi:Uma2 family endonuclease